MSIVNTLKEQCSFLFTGKVNVLLKENGQYIGEVLILDGNLVAAKCDSASSINSLYRLTFDDIDKPDRFKVIIEPEVIEKSQVDFSITFAEFKTEAESRINGRNDMATFRPPNNLQLRVRPEFIINGDELSLYEFEILCNLIDKNTVGELYSCLPFMESDITKALVSLKKKDAFLVSNS